MPILGFVEASNVSKIRDSVLGTGISDQKKAYYNIEVREMMLRAPPQYL